MKFALRSKVSNKSNITWMEQENNTWFQSKIVLVPELLRYSHINYILLPLSQIAKSPNTNNTDRSPYLSPCRCRRRNEKWWRKKSGSPSTSRHVVPIRRVPETRILLLRGSYTTTLEVWHCNLMQFEQTHTYNAITNRMLMLNVLLFCFAHIVYCVNKNKMLLSTHLALLGNWSLFVVQMGDKSFDLFEYILGRRLLTWINFNPSIDW